MQRSGWRQLATLLRVVAMCALCALCRCSGGGDGNLIFGLGADGEIYLKEVAQETRMVELNLDIAAGVVERPLPPSFNASAAAAAAAPAAAAASSSEESGGTHAGEAVGALVSRELCVWVAWAPRSGGGSGGGSGGAHAAPASVAEFEPTSIVNRTQEAVACVLVGRTSFHHYVKVHIDGERSASERAAVAMQLVYIVSEDEGEDGGGGGGGITHSYVADSDARFVETAGIEMRLLEQGAAGVAQEYIGAVILIVMYALIAADVAHFTLIAVPTALVSNAVLAFFNKHPSLEVVFEWLEHGTLGLLFGMMLLVSVISNTGIFEYLAVRAFERSKGNIRWLFCLLCLITAVLSAFLDNVTTILLLAPVTIRLCRVLDVPFLPMLVGETIMSKIGGAATMVGDPPNVVIGSTLSDHLTFMSFITHRTPGAILVSIPSMLHLLWYYRKDIRGHRDLDVKDLKRLYPIKDMPKLRKCAVIGSLVLLGFLLHPVHHVDPAWFAVAGGFLLMLWTSRDNLHEGLQGVEWDALLFFAALFVVVESVSELGLIRAIGEGFIYIVEGVEDDTTRLLLAIFVITSLSSVISAFLDNIPFTVTMLPVIVAMSRSPKTRLPIVPLAFALAWGADLGGNGTLIGASGNILIASIAKQHGESLSFNKFFKVGFPNMIISTVVAILYMRPSRRLMVFLNEKPKLFSKADCVKWLQPNLHRLFPYDPEASDAERAKHYKILTKCMMEIGFETELKDYILCLFYDNPWRDEETVKDLHVTRFITKLMAQRANCGLAVIDRDIKSIPDNVTVLKKEPAGAVAAAAAAAAAPATATSSAHPKKEKVHTDRTLSKAINDASHGVRSDDGLPLDTIHNNANNSNNSNNNHSDNLNTTDDASDQQFICHCQATLHQLITNCLFCGKIVCEEEFNRNFNTKRNISHSKSNTKSSRGGKGKAGKHAHAPPKATSSVDINRYKSEGRCPFCLHCLRDKPQQQQPAPDNERAASEHLAQLLRFDRTAAQRTKVHDDEADYYDYDYSVSAAGGGGGDARNHGNAAAVDVDVDRDKWLPAAERAARTAQRARAALDAKYSVNKDVTLSIDFAGRRFIERK